MANPTDTTLEPVKGATNVDDINDLLKDDVEGEEIIELDEKETKGEKEKDKDEEKDEEKGDEVEETDELDEIEKELEEPDEEDELELVTPVRRAEILKKYPALFKEFPELEKSYFRDRQFTELFVTPSEAKEVKEKADLLDEFEGQLAKGDLTQILKAVKDDNKGNFNRLADNYLEAISQVDEGAFHHVIGKIIKSTIRNMVQEGRTSDDNKVLLSAAQILNQFVFGTSQFSDYKPLTQESDGPTAREKELEEREKNLLKQSFDKEVNSVSTRVETRFKNAISKYIDPRESMSPYVRRTAERDALESVYNLLEKDSRFKSLRDKLWENAAKNSFSSDSIDKVLTLYNSRAKTLLPAVIKRARNEALKGMGKRVKEEETELETDKEPEVRKSTSSSNRGQTPVRRTRPGEIPQGMSNKDFLMSD